MPGIPPPPQRVRARINSTGLALSRRSLNVIAGSGISVSLVADDTNNELDLTISATGTDALDLILTDADGGVLSDADGYVLYVGS